MLLDKKHPPFYEMVGVFNDRKTSSKSYSFGTAPPGFEPGTCALTVRYSTAELWSKKWTVRGSNPGPTD